MTVRALVLIGVAVAVLGCSRTRKDAVNDVIGDESWQLARPPASEVERIRTHLEYVADRLARTPGRDDMIALLRAYAARGEFPHLDHPTAHRMPRFMDPQGRLCAVGFLIAATEGDDVARELAARYEYAYIDEIDDPRLDAWADAHHLTRHELAMIQPEYGFLERASCTAWGTRNESNQECPAEVLDRYGLLLSVGVGGGMSKADGRPLSYFLWGADIRYALTSFLAVGIGDLSARFGDDYTAVVATPLVELSRWQMKPYRREGHQWHLDLGLSLEHVFDHSTTAALGALPSLSQNPFAAEVALGFRIFAPNVAEPDILLGAMVALKDGYVVDERVSAGSVLPFIRFVFGWRP